MGRAERRWRPGRLGKQLKRVSQGSEQSNVKTPKILANLHDVLPGQHVFGYLNLIVLTVLSRQAIPMTFARRCSMRWVMLPGGFEFVFAVAV